MKRTLPAHSFLPRLAALLVLLSPLCVLGVLSCAGLPEAPAELEEARALVEIASPDSLERAAALLSGLDPAAYPETSRLGGLARLLYDFLFPELSGSLALGEGFTAAPEVAALFARAAAGEPTAPAAGPAGDGEPGYFDLLLPALHAARRPMLSRDEAATLLPAVEQAGLLNPEAAPPLYLAGLLSEALEQDDAARKHYRRCLELESSFYPAHRRLADLDYVAGDLESAAGHLEALRRLGLADDALMTRLARIYVQSSRLDEAETLIAEELLRDPGAHELLLLRSEILETRGDWRQALKPVDLVLKLQPDYRPAQLRKARLLAAYLRDPEAVLSYLRELDTAGDPELLELSGRVLLASGRHEEGLKQLKAALALEPGRVTVLRVLARDAADTRLWLQAEESLARLPEESRNEADWLLAHRIYTSLGDNGTALQIAGRLYDQGAHPEHTLLYANTLLAAERRATLRAFITRTLETSPDAEIKSGLLYLQAQLVPADDPQRLRLLQFSLLANPDNPDTLAAIAALYLKQGETRKARNYLRHAVTLNPTNAALAVQLRQLE
jgi:tetratricopeptide (TPR) repeat protein